MAKILTKAGITTGNTVEAFHVTQSIDAFTGIDAYDISLSGSFNMTGPTNINGDTTITGSLTINQTSISSSTESPIIEVKVSDSDSYLRVNNDTMTDGFFTPTLTSRQANSPARLSFVIDSIVDSTYDTPGAIDVMRFRARRDSDFIQNRDLYAWYNYTNRLMVMDAAGNLNIVAGVTASSYTGSFVGDGSGLTGIVSSSYAVTASYADNALSAINTPNAVITASNTGNDDTIEFLKGGGGAFSVTVNNVVSSSYALTASYALNGGGGSDTNFANTDLTFDADRNHDSNGFDFVVSADNGGFNSAYIGYNFSSFMGGITTSSYIGVENTYVETRDQLGVQSIILRVDNTGSIDITGGVSGGVNINSNSLFVSTVTDNVSIGKNTSNAKLDVNGNAIITGSLTVTDTLDANSGSFNYIEADEIIRHTGDNGTGLQFGSDQVTILGNTYINAQFSTTVNTIGNSFLEQPLTIHGDSTFEDRIITTTTDNAITAAGTFNPTGGNRSYVTLNGTIAVTLDDGVQGQILHIYCRDITSAGTTTITPTNKAGFTSIAFDAIGETATLMFADGGGGQWYLISSFGATVS
jgi:hypothetical protein